MECSKLHSGLVRYPLGLSLPKEKTGDGYLIIMGIPVLNGFFSSSSLQICLLSLLFSSKHLQSALSCIYIWSGQLVTYSSRILLFGSLEATLLLNDPLDFDSRSDYNLSWSVYTFHNWVDLNDAIVPSCLFIELIQFSILHVCWTMLSITCGISELLRVFWWVWES